MRKQNAEFKTAFTSEANALKNTDYFGFVELDRYACYVIADGIDDQVDGISAKLAVSAAIAAFSEAPAISRKGMLTCLRAANRALLKAKSKMKLKASILIIITDYAKLRYGHAGNIRLRLYRDGFLKYQSVDQSLSMDLAASGQIPPDKVASHEERNNLYTCLGQEKEFNPIISGKIKLTNSDAIALYTRGIWEHIDEGEIKEVFADATDDPEKTVNDLEDMLLSRQPAGLTKYTLAVIFANKVYVDPGKKRKIRKIILTVIPIFAIVAVLTIVLIVRYNNKQDKIQDMKTAYLKSIEYIQSDNFVRAEEECKNALKLASQVKDKKMEKELSDYQILIETILSADEALDGKKYADASKLFQEAAKRVRYVDNLGKDYVFDRLDLISDYISVYDLIGLGDTLALNLSYDKAEEKYLEAKALSGKIYFDEGRTSAMSALEKLYADQKGIKEAEAEEAKEQAEKQEAAANYMSLGDKAFTQGDYESAKVHYLSAKQKFELLGDEIQASAAEEKAEAANSKIEQQKVLEREADGYMDQAAAAASKEDYTSAKKYYLLAKDIYAALKIQDKVDQIARKMEVLDIKEQEKEKEEDAKEKADNAALADNSAAASADKTKDSAAAEKAGITKTESNANSASESGE
jgi:serine/threonine protein phosphatase PrpC